MNLKQKSDWHWFVCQLLYPAILGSMLYDIFDFAQPITVKQLARFVVVLLYCVDYLHLFRDLQSPTAPVIGSLELTVDVLAALLFRGIFSAVGVDAAVLAILLMTLIGVMFTAYNLTRGVRVSVCYVAGLAWLVLATLGVVYARKWQMEAFLAAALVTLGLYAAFVFKVYNCTCPADRSARGGGIPEPGHL